MKKFISIILSLLITISSFGVGFITYAEALESKAVENFIDDTCELIRSNDSEKNFDTSAAENDFQTCRLIVESSGRFDTCGAVKQIKGFENFHILQYSNEADTKAAYSALQNDDSIISVDIDRVISALQSEEDDEDTSTNVFPESSNGHLCDWATECTQTAQVNEYIKKNNLPLSDITVGVVDSGVDYNHDFLQGRIKRTYFNASSNGEQDDELDLIDGHGTAVCSVIVDNTPNSVNVAVYRVINDDGDLTTLASIMGILKAVEDEVDLINASFGGPSTDTDLEETILNYAQSNDIPVICCAGNEGYDITYSLQLPADAKGTIAVSATSKDNRNCFWSNSGLGVDIAAPGEYINVAVPDNKYDIWSGTSFSTPCISGIFALIKSVYTDYSNDKILNLLKSNALKLKTYYNSSALQIDTFKDTDNFRIIDEDIETHGSGLVQTGKIFGFDKIKSPEINYSSGNYADEITVELKSDYPIYYTLDGTYPTTSSTLYTEPIMISGDTDLRAVAYDENAVIKYSDETECEYQIFETGTDDMFEIDDSGCITSYNGTVKNLLVPSVINGIQVNAFSPKIFNDGAVTKLVLPDTLSEIPQSAFADNSTIQYINTGGAKIVQKASFLSNKSLYTIDMPNVIGIETEAFSKCFGMYSVGFLINAPELDYIKTNGFYTCDYFVLNAPNLTTLYSRAFCQSGLSYAKFPKLNQILKNGINRNAPFYECRSLMILDLPLLEYCESTALTNSCNGIQQINLPLFVGTISNNSTYNYLKYYNILKETAELSGIDYIVVTAKGGSIRVTDAGLRFGFSYDESQGNVEEYGFVYTNGEVENFAVGTPGVRKMVASNRITHEDNSTSFNLVFIKMPKTAFDSMISARAYVKIDGAYFYSDIIHHSFNSVANEVLEDDAIDDEIKEKVKDILLREV